MEIINIKENALKVFSLPPFLLFKILSGVKWKGLLCTTPLYVLTNEDSLVHTRAFVRFPGGQIQWCHHHFETGGKDVK